MRIAAVGDIHGHENLEPFRKDLERLGEIDLFLLAGDTTERNDVDAFTRTTPRYVSTPTECTCPVAKMSGTSSTMRWSSASGAMGVLPP